MRTGLNKWKKGSFVYIQLKNTCVSSPDSNPMENAKTKCKGQTSYSSSSKKAKLAKAPLACKHEGIESLNGISELEKQSENPQFHPIRSVIYKSLRTGLFRRT